MRNKYISMLQNKLLCLNETWTNIYDDLYHRGGNSHSQREDDPDGLPPPPGPKEVIGQELKNNKDGTVSITTNYGDGSKTTKVVKREELLHNIKV